LIGSARAATTRPLRLLVVDEHPVVRYGVRQFADSSGIIGVVDEAASGAEAIDSARRSGQDLALMDAWLPDMLLAEAVSRLRGVSPSTRVLVFASHVSPLIRDQMTRLEVQGFLRKAASLKQFTEAVSRAALGETIADTDHREDLRRAAARLLYAPLTAREYEILQLAARGDSNAEIASAIYLAPTTVKSYLQSALQKLGARNRVEAVFKLSELRLL
jgi:DNA-binding NarL/FixJ family response regulator